MKHRTHHFNEYFMDMKKYVDSFHEVAQLNEPLLG
jgi:hypothetical protein